ncbi:hydrolase [Cupriavidus gilardii]|uniref:Hydrolase n=1 Tax=Cupriavidus gilardii TaxID=82541 RepID=A0A849BAL0_9BURK|nr:hydrolase [Cupriavidus gilardii]NNH12830.1 hydrolase [Cupriavidus gilardii]
MLLSAIAQAESGPPGSGAVPGWQPLGEEDAAALLAALDPAPMLRPAPTLSSPDSFESASSTADPSVPQPSSAEPPAPSSPPVLLASLPSTPASASPSSAASRSALAQMAAESDSAIRAALAADPRDGGRRPSWLLHADDAASGSGFVDTRVRTLSLALDAVLPRSGVTIQPRVQLAYQPRDDGLPNPALAAMPADDRATGLAVRLYGAQPTRLAGVYPFVEADLWQDSSRKTININGTRIDTDLLRGLFSFNIGAHGSTRGGVKIWVKVKTGRNAGGIIGARYRW